MSPVSDGMKNAVPVPTSAEAEGSPKGAGAEEDPQAERRLRRGSQHIGAEHHAPPAEPVTRDAADEQEDQERNGLGRQHHADVGRRAMA